MREKSFSCDMLQNAALQFSRGGFVNKQKHVACLDYSNYCLKMPCCLTVHSFIHSFIHSINFCKRSCLVRPFYLFTVLYHFLLSVCPEFGSRQG